MIIVLHTPIPIENGVVDHQSISMTHAICIGSKHNHKTYNFVYSMVAIELIGQWPTIPFSRDIRVCLFSKGSELFIGNLIDVCGVTMKICIQENVHVLMAY